MRPIERLKLWARRLKDEVYALYLAYRDPCTPWYAKVVVAVVVGYAASPIDLIPDPIPIFGYLDDVILIPLGLALAVRCIPSEVLSECRDRVDKHGVPPPNRIAAFVIVAIWLSVSARALAFLM